MAAPGHAMTKYSLTTREQLERDRAEILERGYALSWQDVTLESWGIGAPVRDSTGDVVASVSLSGLTQRFSAERLPLLILNLVDACSRLSRRLGDGAA